MLTYRSPCVQVVGIPASCRGVISSIDPWELGEDPIETVEFTQRIHPMTLPVGEGDDVIWGVHVGHKARVPGLSPFVQVESIPADLTGLITVEFKGPPDEPILTRAYGGDYTPPLPWMKSVRDAPDGVKECFGYWRTHAYYMKNPAIIRSDTIQPTPPEWFFS